jgi:hypothetical protein
VIYGIVQSYCCEWSGKTEFSSYSSLAIELLTIGTVRMSMQPKRREGGPKEGACGMKPLTNIFVYMDTAIGAAKDNK